MKDENDQPNNKCEQTSGKSNEHQPTQHCQRIKKLAIVATADDAGMYRPFIHFAPVRVCYPSARHNRSYRRKREQNDQDKENPINNRRESPIRLGIHHRDSTSSLTQ